MKRVFATADYYLPAYKAGGPIVSLSRIVSRLNDEVEFSIFTRDRDLGDAGPFPDRPQNEWTDGEGARVFYASPEKLTPRGLLEAIEQTRPEAIYLNSYFSPMTRAALILRSRERLKGIDVVLAPRGEFSPGALRQKSLKKSVYLRWARLLKLDQNILWQASSEREAEDIRREIGGNPRIVVAPDMLGDPFDVASVERAPKSPGAARFACVARITPMKNVHRAIQMLAKVKGEVTFTLYGPKEDEASWLLCQAAMDDLPSSVQVDIAGPIPPHRVRAHLAREQFFLLPTLGENFGHVIAEALSAGLPTLISDRTPWLDLEEHNAGWVVPLEDEPQWLQRLQACVDMDADTYAVASRAALAYIAARQRADDGTDANRLLFGLDGR